MILCTVRRALFLFADKLHYKQTTTENAHKKLRLDLSNFH